MSVSCGKFVQLLCEYVAAVSNDELTDVLKETNIAWSSLMECVSDTPIYVSVSVE